ncbi:MAG: TIGR00730 family Rossman fold protein [Rhizobiales bacterium]|nr:TIGR00730 family Rossman fold protein [Hyphomicrobiales bacterium]
MKVCVFCGSSEGVRPQYREAALALGRAIAARGDELVYGGSKVGLMGAVADATLGAGGRAIGVLPRALRDKEIAHEGLTELHIVESMHQRKAMMADLSGAFVALPGGMGTFEEVFEIWTWAQLGYHRKPVGLLDIEGYYDRLLAFLDQTVEEGFVKPEHRRMAIVETDPALLLDRFATYEPPTVAKWIKAGER